MASFTVIYDANVLYPAPLRNPEDRHVLAAALRANAEIIVTANLKDFLPDSLKPYNVTRNVR